MAGANGDLLIVIMIRPHSKFTRKGADLYIDMPITGRTGSPWNEHHCTRTLNDKVSYKVPAGTQPNTMFRLKAKGIKDLKSKKMGDLYVKVLVKIPTNLTEEQRDLIEKLDKTMK